MKISAPARQCESEVSILWCTALVFARSGGVCQVFFAAKGQIYYNLSGFAPVRKWQFNPE